MQRRGRSGHSAAIAASTSSFAARRAGQLAATRPRRAASTRNTTRLGIGTTTSVIPCFLSDDDERDAEPGAHDNPDECTEDRKDHRLGADHDPHLAPAHAHGPQETDLVGSLEHREHEGVYDADERDGHGERQQSIDEAEQLVHLRLLRLDELGPGLDLEPRIAAQAMVMAAVMSGDPLVVRTSTATGSGLREMGRGRSCSPAR